ncbi:MAG: hypothetical protein WA769_02270, partial [Pseudolabrys sp.]
RRRFHESRRRPASLSALLEEFDRETAPAASPDGSPELHAAANGNDPTAVNEALARSQNAWLEAQKSGMATDLMKSRIDTLSNHLGAIHQEQAQMRDQSDFSQVVNDADKMLREAGAVVGEDFAKRWLIAESKLNPALTAAFDNRYASKDHLRQANRQVKKSMDKMLKAAKAMPDPQATEDRWAVAAAVRGTSSRVPERPTNKFSEQLYRFMQPACDSD